MKDDQKLNGRRPKQIKNGRRPKQIKNGRQPKKIIMKDNQQQKWKTTNQFEMEDDQNIQMEDGKKMGNNQKKLI